MRGDRLAVYEPLMLVSLRRRGRRIRITLRDRDGACYTVVLRFAARRTARLEATRLAMWRDCATALAYIQGAHESAIIDVDALFARLAAA